MPEPTTERASLPAGQLAAQLDYVPPDARVYLWLGDLWAITDDHSCIVFLGRPDTPHA
jgi:hypothetical protein